jgi:hypothetical protein
VSPPKPSSQPVEPQPATDTTAAPATYATLIIHVDTSAVVTIDGKAEPPGTTATVRVQPGVEHIITVQSPGHSLRRLHVPALSPGEQMPLHFNVR